MLIGCVHIVRRANDCVLHSGRLGGEAEAFKVDAKELRSFFFL